MAVKNWRTEVPKTADELYEVRDRKSVRRELIPHTSQFGLVLSNAPIHDTITDSIDSKST